MKKSSGFALLCLLSSTLCIPLSQFYPYGRDSSENGQRLGSRNSITSGPEVLEQYYFFYGEGEWIVTISNDGAIFFGSETDTNYVQSPFPLGGKRRFVAPFWADVDTTSVGDVWYRQTRSQTLLDRANTQIKNAFSMQPQFTATNLLIVTWDHVGYFNNRANKTNTFQCILATNGLGRQTYAIFLYADGEIQWTTGDDDGGINGLGGLPAQIGFNKGDGVTFATITKSRTHDIIKIASASNTGTPGVLVFKISDKTISTKNLNFTTNDNDELATTFNAKSGQNDYYLSFINNYDGGNASILIMTTDFEAVSYSIQAPGIGFYQNGTITADHEVIVGLPSTAEVTSHIDQNKGIYLKTSSSSVTVIGQNVLHGTDDTFLVQPIVKLSDKMYVYYGMSVPRTIVHGENLHSSVLIVGTEDNTMMQLTATQLVTITVNNITSDLTPSKHYSFVINRLQTVYIESLEDLTGTKIVANKPISVFSGHECGNVPYNIYYCDYLVEQIPPTTFWGKVYYTAPLATRRSYTIKILAAHDSTIININCNKSLETYAINEGEFFNKTLHLQEYCVLSSNENILVVQLTHGYNDDGTGEPMMTLVPPTSQYAHKFQFSTLRNKYYNHYVNLIVLAQYYQPNMINLLAGNISRSLNNEHWEPVRVNNIIEAYATQVAITEGVVEIIHSNPAALMTAIVYGFSLGAGDTYGHPGGLIMNTFKTHSGLAPIFIISPLSQTVNLSVDNQNISLSCKANGTLSYVWDRQNGSIPSGSIGKNTNILTLINVQPKDSGNYRCVATNNYGTNTSDYATLTINVLPVDKPCKVTNIAGVITVDREAVTLTFSTNHLEATFQCRIDKEKLSPCSSPTTWTNVNIGKHFIVVVARCSDQNKKIKKKFKFQIL